MRIAVVGAGVSGLYAAWRLSATHEVTLFEAADYAGGHTNTVDVEYRRPPLVDRHGFHRLQRLDLPELHRDAERTGRGVAAIGHELQPAL